MTSRAKRRTLVGWVVSDRMDKTIGVRIDRKVVHPVYAKVLNLSKPLKAHDEKEEAEIGDKVVLMETRPLSKTKCWRLVEILESSARRQIQATAKGGEEEMREYQKVGLKEKAEADASSAPSGEAKS